MNTVNYTCTTYIHVLNIEIYTATPVTFSHAPGISPTKGNYQSPSKFPNNENITTVTPRLRTRSITQLPTSIEHRQQRDHHNQDTTSKDKYDTYHQRTVVTLRIQQDQHDNRKTQELNQTPKDSLELHKPPGKKLTNKKFARPPA
jgi:hypothetical protein